MVQSAQTPVVYTKADGSKVYKHSDGNFYDKPEGQPGAQQVQPGDVIASMQNADGTTTLSTTLANVKGNLADTTAELFFSRALFKNSSACPVTMGSPN